MVDWRSILGIRPSSKELAPLPIVNSFLIDIRKKIESKLPFSVVYVQVDEGNVGEICNYVGGKKAGKGVGFILPPGDEYKVYNSLESLADAPFASRLRVGCTSYYDKDTPGRMMVRVQESYVCRSYSGKKVVEQAPVLSLETALEPV